MRVFSWCTDETVEDKLDRMLSGEGKAPSVLQRRGKNIHKIRNEKSRRRLKEASGKVRDLCGIPVVCGVHKQLIPYRRVRSGKKDPRWMTSTIIYEIA